MRFPRCAGHMAKTAYARCDLDSNPIVQFQLWLKEAAANPVLVEANAMVLSTISGDQPTTRTVLLKDVSDGGFTFFTNYNSTKSKTISKNSKVSLLSLVSLGATGKDSGKCFAD